MAFRKNNTYKYEPGKNFRLSRSAIDSFMKCNKCFYINRRMNVKDIGMPGFSLNSAVDELLKKEFDHHRESKTAHPYMKSTGRNLIPFAHEDLDTWRDNFKGVSYLHEETNLTITGAIDDVWIDLDTDELIVVEYKSTSTNSEISLNDGTPWKEGYKRQIDIYQWLLKMNGFQVSDDSWFIYANGLKTVDSFSNELKFDTLVLKYTGSTDWVEPKILEIKKLLDQDTIPDSSDNCETCSYVTSVNSL